MSHEVETMAYVGETPWHSLGNKNEGIPTVEEMTKAAGLDWKVARHPIFTQIGEEKIGIDGRVAIVRDIDNRVLSTASDKWIPFQNKELMEFFREYVDAGHATLETAGSLKDGKVIWALANINAGFTLNGRDEVKGYVLFSNSHEPGAAIRILTTSVRVVCQNTLRMAHNGKDQYKQTHLKDFNPAAAREQLAFSRHQIEEFGLEAQALSQLQMSAYDTVRVLAKHFQPDMAESAMDIQILLNNPDAQNPVLSDVLHSVVTAPGALPESAWGLLNGVTHYADHVAGRTAGNRMISSTFGALDKTKQAVRMELLEMAGYQIAA